MIAWGRRYPFGGGRQWQGQLPHKEKKSRFYGPDRKNMSASSDFEKIIVHAFLKAISLQIPY
jgi:hypothetical protein